MDKIDFINAQAPALNDENLNKMQDNIERAINAQVSGDTLPIGTVLPYTNETAPENWLVCDGSELDRTEYNHLFAIIGTTFGEGDGSTTFNLPNLKGRTIVGLDADDADFNTIGKTIGEKTHTLTVAEMPKHSHTLATPQYYYGESNTGSIYGSNTTTSQFTRNTNTSGNNQPHNNIQPSFIGVYIIKAKQSAGVVATVVDSLESTSATDALSAKQGKELNEKIDLKSNYINAGIAQSLTLSNATNKIPLNVIYSKSGELLTLNSSGEIVIGAGISQIQVSGAAFCEDFGGSGYCWIKIFKNESIITSSIASAQQGIYVTVSAASKAINVQEGDKIILKLENTTRTKVRNDSSSSFVCVNVLN